MPTSLASPPRRRPAPRRADAALVAALRRGDDAAYERLVDLHGGRMLAVARRIMGRDDDALDAVQDALIGAFRGIDRFDGTSALGTWLHAIVVNACRMAKRRRARRPELALDDLVRGASVDVPDLQRGPLDRLSASETHAQVRDAIERLPDSYAVALRLRHLDERDLADVAAHLGVTHDTIKTRLYRARRALRPILEPHLEPVGALP